jgi:hypothetical protein
MILRLLVKIFNLLLINILRYDFWLLLLLLLLILLLLHLLFTIRMIIFNTVIFKLFTGILKKYIIQINMIRIFNYFFIFINILLLLLLLITLILIDFRVMHSDVIIIHNIIRIICLISGGILTIFFL